MNDRRLSLVLDILMLCELFVFRVVCHRWAAVLGGETVLVPSLMHYFSLVQSENSDTELRMFCCHAAPDIKKPFDLSAPLPATGVD